MSLWQTPEDEGRVVDRFNALPPTMPEDVGFFAGVPEAVGKVPLAIGARAALAIEEPATPALRAAAKATLADDYAKPVDEWLLEQQRITREAILSAMPSPQTVGKGGEIIHSLGVMLPEMVGATLLTGSPVGGFAYEATVERAAKIVQLEAQGIDHDAALLLATGHGLLTGAGVFLPGMIGSTAVSQILGQAGIGVGIGVGQRKATATFLESAGYPEMAAQIHPFAVAEMLTDGILQGALGVFLMPRGVVIPRERMGLMADAAMVSNSAGHLQVDTAPGAATNTRSTTAHVEAEVAMMDGMLRGESPDVTPIIAGAKFEPVPAVEAARRSFADDVNEQLQMAADEAERDQAARFGLPTEHPAPEPVAVAVAASMRAEIGWAERGGRMIRAAGDVAEMEMLGVGAGQGEVVGRTKWIPKSDFWPNRPDQRLSEKQAHQALDKAGRGEALKPIERRFVDYAQAEAQRRIDMAPFEEAITRSPEGWSARDGFSTAHILLSRDVNQQGKWRITTIDELMQPLNHVEYDTQAEAISDFVQRANPKTLVPPAQSEAQVERAAIQAEAEPLATYTNQDVIARERVLLAASKRSEAERKTLEAKAIADAQRATFGLSGSDRAADANPEQGSMFEPAPRFADFPGSPDDPVSRATLMAAADARIAEADGNGEKAVIAAINCDIVEGGT